MIASMLMGFGLISGSAHAAEKLIRYDSYPMGIGEEHDPEQFIFGAFFDGQPGLGKYSCMAQVYSFEDEDYPLVPTELRVFWAGEGAGAASEVLLKIYFYLYEGDADAWSMAAGQYDLLDVEEVLLDEISLEGTWKHINLAESGFNFDGDKDTEGRQPIEYGSIVANVCYENEQTMPSIAFDVDGFRTEPLPEGDEEILTGHETSQFRNMIYWNGLWTDLHTYLMNTFGYDGAGDFIMRLVIDAQWELDTGGEGPSNLIVDQVVPEEQLEGESVSVLISGLNIDQNASARIGEYELSSVTVGGDGETMNGRTNKEMKPGVYAVVVTNPDGSEVAFEDAFTVFEETKGCGCTVASGSAAAWWLPLLGLGWLRRRRS